ncbi:IclR family transcriptional regulator C-terminal domain-containing protein [Castellaniella sp.]|uniref:IclR family transcriptional regulator domain-containing protein n=1 Tax=Castellaniella sp. TaxID=1955812 RepID=UPI003565BC8B
MSPDSHPTRSQTRIVAPESPFAPAAADDGLLSFARGIAVMEVFSRHHAPLSMADIARRTRLPRATIRRILITLRNLGYVLEIDRKYRLTPKILTLAQGYLASSGFPAALQPILEDITAQTGESSSFAVLDGTEIIYVARSAEEKMRIMSNSLHVGSTLPAYCTSMGRAILAQLPRHRQAAILQASNRLRHTEHTVVDVDALLKILAADQANGYSIVNQELETGLCAIAVPVMAHDAGVAGAINISTHVLRTDPGDVRRTYLPVLQAALKMIFV